MVTMAGTVTDFTPYNEKRVNIKAGPLGDEIVEGLVVAGTPQGLIFKQKGKSSSKLLSAAEVESIEIIPEAPVSLKAAKLKPITAEHARKHLLDRHGWTLEQVNGVSDEQAFQVHTDIDHEGLGLGHVHVETPATETPAVESDTDPTTPSI